MFGWYSVAVTVLTLFALVVLVGVLRQSANRLVGYSLVVIGGWLVALFFASRVDEKARCEAGGGTYAQGLFKQGFFEPYHCYNENWNSRPTFTR